MVAMEARRGDEWDEQRLQRMYDDLAPSYHWVARVNDTLFGVTALRRWAMAHASGDVLDVACGTGANFPHLPRIDRLTAVDLSAGMLRRAGERAGQLDLDADLLPMSAQALAFPDATFDTVASAMATCSFTDPLAALREMARVTRPGGSLLLVEHGRSSCHPLGRVQDLLADRQYRQAGCRWNQDPQQLARDAGLTIDGMRSRTLGVMVAMVIPV